MKKYMFFSPAGPPPWEFPAIEKSELIYDISSLGFISNAHIKLEDEINNYGLQFANRTIEIIAHPSIKNAYTVSLFNEFREYLTWNINIQIQPIIMKPIRQNENKIELIGFGHDENDNDYRIME